MSRDKPRPLSEWKINKQVKTRTMRVRRREHDRQIATDMLFVPGIHWQTLSMVFAICFIFAGIEIGL